MSEMPGAHPASSPAALNWERRRPRLLLNQQRSRLVTQQARTPAALPVFRRLFTSLATCLPALQTSREQRCKNSSNQRPLPIQRQSHTSPEL